MDFAITNYPNSGLSNTQNVRISREFKDVLVATDEYKELRGKTISLKDLKRFPILMLDRKSTTSEFLHSMFQRHQLDLVPEIELSSNDLLIDLARIGLGVAFVPDYCIPDNERSLFKVQIEEELPTRQIVVASNDSLPISQAAKQFMEML